MAEEEEMGALLDVTSYPKREIRLKLTRRRRVRRLRLATKNYGFSPGVAASQDRRRARDREAGRKAAQALRELEIRRRIKLGGREVTIPKNLQPKVQDLLDIFAPTPKTPVGQLLSRPVKGEDEPNERGKVRSRRKKGR